MDPVNGKTYPMWGQFIDRKEEWIGGKLQQMDVESMLGDFGDVVQTKITDLLLKPNGEDSAYFEVVGEDFTCGFDVRYGGVDASNAWLSEKGWVGFGTVGSFPISFRIKQREATDEG